MIRSWIQEHHGETIFVTDADIIYFRPFLDQLLEDLGEAKLAFACKGMGEGYNIGQMVIRCDDEVLDFFEQIDALLERREWDEQAVNDLLRTSPLPRRNLSRLFTDTSSWAALDDRSRLVAFSYHATETFPTAHTTSLEEKQKRIDEVLHWREQWRSDTPV